MQKIVIFILILCFALALYSYCFHPGQTLSFQAAYNNAMQLVKTVGGAFDSVKTTVTDSIKTVLGLPEAISNFFKSYLTNLGKAVSSLAERIRQFFVNLVDSIFGFFRKDDQTKCTCENPALCKDCNCLANDCICGKFGEIKDPLLDL